MKNKKYRITAIVIIALVVIAFSVVSWNSSEMAVPPPALLAAPYIQPVKEDIADWDEYIGRFAASERVEVRSKVNGYIESVRFTDGDIVKKGQVLFVIDQRPFMIELKQAEAEKLKAKADLKRTESDYQRIASVQDSRAVSTEEVEQRQQIAKSAEAQLMAANAQLAEARLNLSYTEIKAPISGKISDVFIDPGNYVTGGTSNATPLTTILNVDPIHFYFEGSETDFQGRQQPDRELPVSLKLADEEAFSRYGKMDFVDNEINESTGTLRGRAIFENPGLELQSGMFGRIRLITDKKPVLLIPEEAIGTNQSQKIVYSVAEDSTIRILPVQLGKLYHQKYRIVTGGISLEDKIITGNLLKVRPGMKVAPRQTDFNISPDSTALTVNR